MPRGAEGCRGVPRAYDVKEKISKALIGKEFSESTRKTISISNGYAVLVNCITDQVDKSYCSYRQLNED